MLRRPGPRVGAVLADRVHEDVARRVANAVAAGDRAIELAVPRRVGPVSGPRRHAAAGRNRGRAVPTWSCEAELARRPGSDVARAGGKPGSGLLFGTGLRRGVCVTSLSDPSPSCSRSRPPAQGRAAAHSMHRLLRGRTPRRSTGPTARGAGGRARRRCVSRAVAPAVRGGVGALDPLPCERRARSAGDPARHRRDAHDLELGTERVGSLVRERHLATGRGQVDLEGAAHDRPWRDLGGAVRGRRAARALVSAECALAVTSLEATASARSSSRVRRAVGAGRIR